ncbi:DUF2690 domain-containing protein [Streptomyces sp. cg36]|uniref:helix-turn-helix domain-containing protein n=1 Tax=Streptomyces sp. cg36 TaxID=3238798 RepID=UPI0034E1E853
MPRWKALPDELDPQVREFASQLRRLVDRSGLSLAAVADRTGYSKTSWERYLGGRLLAPKGAIVALAEVTGTNPLHLTTMWELAERAWSRAEMRHDMTMEQIRISQARAALGEFGPVPGGPQSPVAQSPAPQRSAEPLPAATRPGAPGTPGGPAGHQGVPGMPQPEPAGAGRGRGPAVKDPGRGGRGPGGRRRLVMFVAGVLGALLVIAAAVLLTDLGGGDGTAAPAPSPTPTTAAPSLPAGVKCVHEGCTGQDPETMGCGGAFAKTVTSAKIGTALVQVRYSQTCGAAWARIQQAAPGDRVTIGAYTATGTRQGGSGTVDADKEAYTKMLAVDGPASARACATLAAGKKGCTARQR